MVTIGDKSEIERFYHFMYHHYKFSDRIIQELVYLLVTFICGRRYLSLKNIILEDHMAFFVLISIRKSITCYHMYHAYYIYVLSIYTSPTPILDAWYIIESLD